MPHTYKWTPKNVVATPQSTVKITRWDGTPQSDTSYFISGNLIIITVNTPDRYKVTLISGPSQESATLTIPTPTAPISPNDPQLESRLMNYIDDRLSSLPTTPTPPTTIKPDTTPGYEGYFTT